jgi:hypothetical protein
LVIDVRVRGGAQNFGIYGGGAEPRRTGSGAEEISLIANINRYADDLDA